uniref:Uncharacterized protein n=1 Tax=Melopsittacus undulatus TaxID=13146 RepID=A0A8V5GU60_MELUD
MHPNPRIPTLPIPCIPIHASQCFPTQSTHPNPIQCIPIHTSQLFPTQSMHPNACILMIPNPCIPTHPNPSQSNLCIPVHPIPCIPMIPNPCIPMIPNVSPHSQMDLLPFINKAGCECLNESDQHGFDNCLRRDASYLESDCDQQLLITVAFSQPVKLYSMKFQGPDNGQGPKSVKIFTNLPRSMDFEEAERSEPTQSLELSRDEIREDGIIPLRYVKFQNVNSVTLFVQSNHGDEETTRISYFTFIGTPVQATNMNDFKRVVGKKGESH